jgi:tryptophan 2,3-dioxygenase
MSYDILSAEMSDTTTLHLSHPNNGLMYADEAETKPVEITLYGRSSKQHRQWLAVALRKQEANRKQKAKTPDEMLEENAEFFATMTVSISNMKMGATEVKSKEDFKKLYSNPKLMWITEQVSEKLGDVESFLQK